MMTIFFIRVQSRLKNDYYSAKKNKKQ